MDIWDKVIISVEDCDDNREGFISVRGLFELFEEEKEKIDSATVPEDLLGIIELCAEITQSKGSDVTQHLTQVCLMVTELGEALEHIEGRKEIEGLADFFDSFRINIRKLSSQLEERRQGMGSEDDYCPPTRVIDEYGLLEELADAVIRIFSYVGGNGMGERFVESLYNKIEINKTRPHMHGKKCEGG